MQVLFYDLHYEVFIFQPTNSPSYPGQHILSFLDQIFLFLYNIYTLLALSHFLAHVNVDKEQATESHVSSHVRKALRLANV